MISPQWLISNINHVTIDLTRYCCTVMIRLLGNQSSVCCGLRKDYLAGCVFVYTEFKPYVPGVSMLVLPITHHTYSR